MHTVLLYIDVLWVYHLLQVIRLINLSYDDVIKWKHFSRYWPFVRGIHQSSVISPHKGQWRGAWILYLICFLINAQMASYAENVSIWWRHHDLPLFERKDVSQLHTMFWEIICALRKIDELCTCLPRKVCTTDTVSRIFGRANLTSCCW